MKRAFIFPGQGSQSVGMGKAASERVRREFGAARLVSDMAHLYEELAPARRS